MKYLTTRYATQQQDGARLVHTENDDKPMEHVRANYKVCQYSYIKEMEFRAQMKA